MATFDAVLVGSGINTLTAAALLARDGWSVCVLERSDRLGGAIRTEADYTLPGFTHEVLSSWHPLFQGSAAYAELGDELHRRGLEYVNTELPTATAFPDGAAMFLQTSLEANVAEFDRFAEGDGAAWQRQFEGFMANADVSFGVLGTELWSSAGLGLGQKMLRRFGRRGLLDFAGHALATCRDWTGGDVPLGAGPWPARAVGPPHRARARQRGLGVHDAGDRVRGAAGRHARAGRRRRHARRRARGDRDGRGR